MADAGCKRRRNSSEAVPDDQNNTSAVARTLEGSSQGDTRGGHTGAEFSQFIQVTVQADAICSHFDMPPSQTVACDNGRPPTISAHRSITSCSAPEMAENSSAVLSNTSDNVPSARLTAFGPSQNHSVVPLLIDTRSSPSLQDFGQTQSDTNILLRVLFGEVQDASAQILSDMHKIMEEDHTDTKNILARVHSLSQLLTSTKERESSAASVCQATVLDIQELLQIHRVNLERMNSDFAQQIDNIINELPDSIKSRPPIPSLMTLIRQIYRPDTKQETWAVRALREAREQAEAKAKAL